MANTEQKEIQVKEKKELSGLSEQTTAGPVFTPDVDIFESDQEITLLADIPGVNAENLNIDLRENILTITGEVSSTRDPEQQELTVEYEPRPYHSQFSLSNVIDQNKIDAKLMDGVLMLRLPKVEKAPPKKFEIKVACSFFPSA